MQQPAPQCAEPEPEPGFPAPLAAFFPNGLSARCMACAPARPRHGQCNDRKQSCRFRVAGDAGVPDVEPPCFRIGEKAFNPPSLAIRTERIFRRGHICGNQQQPGLCTRSSAKSWVPKGSGNRACGLRGDGRRQSCPIAPTAGRMAPSGNGRRPSCPADRRAQAHGTGKSVRMRRPIRFPMDKGSIFRLLFSAKQGAIKHGIFLKPFQQALFQQPVEGSKGPVHIFGLREQKTEEVK